MNSSVIDGEILAGPAEDDRSFEGVRTKRVFAFLIDYVLIGLLLVPAAILVAMLGLLTFGLGWALFAVLAPAVAMLYVAVTLGGSAQATPGMRAMGLRVERLDGGRINGLLAVVHTVLFWAGNTVLTPFVLLVTFFADRKRALHDLLLGTVVVRSDQRLP